MSSVDINPADSAQFVRDEVVKLIRGRIAEQRIKGPKRQANVALEMLIGATAALHVVGKTREANALSLLAMLVSVRGMDVLPS
jgi:hypothetical protein